MTGRISIQLKVQARFVALSPHPGAMCPSVPGTIRRFSHLVTPTDPTTGWPSASASQ